MPLPRAAWLLRRAELARTLYIGQLYGNALKIPAQALLQAPPCFGNLTSLVLNHREDLYARMCNEEETKLLLMLWLCLAGQARQLQFLSLTLKSLQSLPHLPHLKHLQLHLTGGDCRCVMQYIPRLSSLQTLHMYCAHALPEHRPAVDMATMTPLQSVSLDGVVPGLLALAEGTALHVRLYEICDARDPIWVSALPSLRTFHLDVLGYEVETEEQMPSSCSVPATSRR